MRALATRHKVRIARYLAKGVLGARRVVGQGRIAEVSRMSINWRLDPHAEESRAKNRRVELGIVNARVKYTGRVN